MNNKPSSTSIRIIPFPNLDEVVPARWEDLRKMSLKGEPCPEEETGNKVKVEEIKEEEPEQEGDDESTPDEYPPNPYQFNIRGSILLFPLGPPQKEWGKEPPTPEEIKEKIKNLEQVSKACVNTIGEGIDSYWLMSKDLEAQVDGLFHKIGLMVDTINPNTA